MEEKSEQNPENIKETLDISQIKYVIKPFCDKCLILSQKISESPAHKHIVDLLQLEKEIEELKISHKFLQEKVKLFENIEDSKVFY